VVPTKSADEFVERAVEMLHEHEEWLAENRTRIEHGFAQAERGELLDGEAAIQELRRRRDERRNQS
jgi:predicted transcriptional regulator